MQKHMLAILTLGSALFLGATARAQSGDAILDLLVRKGVINQREANEVREQLDQEAIKTQEVFNKTKVSSWVDTLKWSGDFRLRTEFFDNGDQLDKKPKLNGQDDVDRWRFRYRLRLQLDAAFVDWAKVGVRLASGEAAPGDPVSTNQSETDTFKKKPITIDAAFVTIQPPGWDWLKVTGGKMDLPIWQPKFNSPMMYDTDLTPEGVAEQIDWKFGDKQQYRLFANFGQFVVKEISGIAADPACYDFQVGAELRFGNDPKNPRFRVAGAVGYFITDHLVNQSYSYGDSPNKGNAVKQVIVGTTTNKLAAIDDFEVLHAGGEVGWLISERPFLGTPALLTLSGAYVANLNQKFEDLTDSLDGATATLDQTEGWTIQAVFGEAKKKGQWQVAYQYKWLEADAVWDALTDSDWGAGGTDRGGHVIKAAYNLQDWWQIGFAAFITEKISNRPNKNHNAVGSILDEHNDLLRIQIDSVIKF